MSREARHAVAEEVLDALGCSSGLRVGAVYRRTAARRGAYGAERDVVYAEFVRYLDARLRSAGECGVLVMDGDGSVTGYDEAHRRLDMGTRRIVDDPFFKPAHRSAMVRLADITAWTAYQGLLRHTGKEFAWHWYGKYLLRCDVNGGPLEV